MAAMLVASLPEPACATMTNQPTFILSAITTQQITSPVYLLRRINLPTKNVTRVIDSRCHIQRAYHARFQWHVNGTLTLRSWCDDWAPPKPRNPTPKKRQNAVFQTPEPMLQTPNAEKLASEMHFSRFHEGPQEQQDFAKGWIIKRPTVTHYLSELPV